MFTANRINKICSALDKQDFPNFPDPTDGVILIEGAATHGRLRVVTRNNIRGADHLTMEECVPLMRQLLGPDHVVFFVTKLEYYFDGEKFFEGTDHVRHYPGSFDAV